MSLRLSSKHRARTCSQLAIAAVFATTAAMNVTAEDWQELSIVDVDAFPVDEQPRFYSKSKSIYRGPGGASLIWAQFNPRFDDAPPQTSPGLGHHYHHFHEWALVLEGDYVIHEVISPRQRGGAMYQYLEGTWLDRPAYTLHGGSWEIGGMRSQMPCTLLIFEEGDGSVVTIGADGDHFKPDFPNSKPDPYDPDWEAVERFDRPWIVNSVQQLGWERDADDPSRWVKWLSDDPKAGFQARLIKVPPGWESETSTAAQWYEKANRFLYLTWGDLRVQRYDAAGDPAELVEASGNWFVHQPPRALLSHGSGAASDGGAIWLEVIYAEGITLGGGPIEPPKVRP